MYQVLDQYPATVSGSKKKKLAELTLLEKLDIYDDVVVKKDYHENVCA